MEVILRAPVEKLGDMGEIVNVRNGYARNYLIPRELAYFATPGSKKKIEVEKKLYVRKVAKEKQMAEELAKQLAEIQISLPMKVGEEGKLYGSVSNHMIAGELEHRGFNIDRRHIIIDDPIKSLGVFDIKVKLHAEVMASLKIWVINEEE